MTRATSVGIGIPAILFFAAHTGVFAGETSSFKSEVVARFDLAALGEVSSGALRVPTEAFWSGPNFPVVDGLLNYTTGWQHAVAQFDKEGGLVAVLDVGSVIRQLSYARPAFGYPGAIYICSQIGELARVRLSTGEMQRVGLALAPGGTVRGFESGSEHKVVPKVRHAGDETGWLQLWHDNGGFRCSQLLPFTDGILEGARLYAVPATPAAEERDGQPIWRFDLVYRSSSGLGFDPMRHWSVSLRRQSPEVPPRLVSVLRGRFIFYASCLGVLPRDKTTRTGRLIAWDPETGKQESLWDPSLDSKALEGRNITRDWRGRVYIGTTRNQTTYEVYRFDFAPKQQRLDD